MEPIITIHRPTLTPEEREARMQTIREAVAAVCIAQQKARRPQKEEAKNV